ncbi:hypothetical protein SGPA1_11357 [Streptomyces misionensis JCM 4497]
MVDRRRTVSARGRQRLLAGRLLRDHRAARAARPPEPGHRPPADHHDHGLRHRAPLDPLRDRHRQPRPRPLPLPRLRRPRPPGPLPERAAPVRRDGRPPAAAQAITDFRPRGRPG